MTLRYVQEVTVYWGNWWNLWQLLWDQGTFGYNNFIHKFGHENIK